MRHDTFNETWTALRGHKLQMPHFLDAVTLTGLRGLENLRVRFEYPVTVIAGANATGKSTVLFASACAYKVPGSGYKDYVPSTLFPNYNPKHGSRRDNSAAVTIAFDYSTPDGRLSMRWRKSKGWNRSFAGRKGASQPERNLYLRTLSNLSNPSEVRGLLRMSLATEPPSENHLVASQLAFAKRMLPFDYSDVVNLGSKASKYSKQKSLLFAEQNSGPTYSELHMASGERTILRLSQDIAQLDGALVLIDEIEAGLHPWVQQLLMLELQRLALRRNLQVIVTTHSPVILDAVPPEARVFLDRDHDGRVTVVAPYRDIIQNALYGRTDEALNVLCEDKIAEAIVRGAVDYLNRTLMLSGEPIIVARDIGASEFAGYARALARLDLGRNFIYVLDGDMQNTPAHKKLKDEAARAIVLFLPGSKTPEDWIWEQLVKRQSNDETAKSLGVSKDRLKTEMDKVSSYTDTAPVSATERAKTKLYELGVSLSRSDVDICRIVAYDLANDKSSDIQPLVEGLENAILVWRAAT